MTKPIVIIIVQARMGSKRFPGKIMAPFPPMEPGGERKSVLEWCLTRCRDVPGGPEGVSDIMLATPNSDDHADAWATAVRCHCYPIAPEVDEGDVLGRYYKAAQIWWSEEGKHYADGGNHENFHIVRVTADCPLINPKVIEGTLRLHLATGSDYTSNVHPRSFPKGWDVEVMTWDSLEAAHVKATSKYDREHVTPWLVRTPGIKRANYEGGTPDRPLNWSYINLCVDNPGDIEQIEELLERRPLLRKACFG